MLPKVNYGNGYKGTNRNMEIGVDAGQRGGQARFGIHGGSSQAVVTKENTVVDGQVNSMIVVVEAGGVTYEHIVPGAAERVQRETDNLDNAWTGAENPTAAPIELGCRVDGPEPLRSRPTFPSVSHSISNLCCAFAFNFAVNSQHGHFRPKRP